MKQLLPRLLMLFAAVLLITGCVTDPRDRAVAADYYNVGNAYSELGQDEKAIQYYENALRLDPSLAKANLNLALAYSRMKRTDDAASVLKRLLLDDPQNTQLLSALGWAYHLGGREGDALDQYDAVIALSPADQDAIYDSGIILWKLDRKSEALNRFRKLLDIAPEDADGLYAAGSLLLAMDDPAGSGDMLSRYLAKKPDDLEALYLVAAGAERLQKYSRALEAYDSILAVDSKQADAWFGQTRLLLTVIEDPQKGLDALSHALDAGFKDAVAVKALLDSSGLLERDKVEAELKQHDLLPEATPAAPQ